MQEINLILRSTPDDPATGNSTFFPLQTAATVLPQFTLLMLDELEERVCGKKRQVDGDVSWLRFMQ